MLESSHVEASVEALYLPEPSVGTLALSIGDWAFCESDVWQLHVLDSWDPSMRSLPDVASHWNGRWRLW